MKEIDSTLRNLVEKNRTPSVQYAVFNRDSMIHHSVAGFANISKRIGISESTTYNWFSVTKTFTALAVLQLAEQEKLGIDQPVKKYLPDFPYNEDITIKQLLSHTAGVPNPIPLRWTHLADEHASFNRDDYFRQVFEKNKKTKSGPGEKFAYSNLGYVILGSTIEKVSGLTYEDYVRKNIIRYLNIKDHKLDFTIYVPDNQATGYHKKWSLSNTMLGLLIDRSKFMGKTEGKWTSFMPGYVNGTSYGGLIGTAGAFVNYIRELLKPDCRLITNESRNMMFTETMTHGGKPTGMCLSWFTGRLNGNQYFAHAGGGGGYYCEIRIYRELGIGSMIVFNRTGMKDDRFLDKVDAYVVAAMNA